MKCNFYGAKILIMMIFLSLHTRNVNPLARNVNPLKKSIFMGGV